MQNKIPRSQRLKTITDLKRHDNQVYPSLDSGTPKEDLSRKSGKIFSLVNNNNVPMLAYLF